MKGLWEYGLTVDA